MSLIGHSVGLVSNIALIVPVGMILLNAKYKKIKGTNYDPIIVKKDKIPILLLHGKGFNQAQWIIGRYYLNNKQCGSVFTMDYDGLISNEKNKTIEDYSILVNEKILEIKNKTGHNEIILIGHSLGGLVASYYAEYVADLNGIIVKNVITIATPWHQPPGIKYIAHKHILYQQMSEPYLHKLRTKVIDSITKKFINYYTIGSETDLMVPDQYSYIDSKIQRHQSYEYLGHYTIVASLKVWKYINNLIHNHQVNKLNDQLKEHQILNQNIEIKEEFIIDLNTDSKEQIIDQMSDSKEGQINDEISDSKEGQINDEISDYIGEQMNDDKIDFNELNPIHIKNNTKY